ncbi:zinc ribbon domain-containing protein [Sphaerisporangium album]|uniref:Zinc ribbon domain-containing protein n=1 Tax=Sphaerisporangium album TaxID=509200 RepID=A0A367FER8_9ACTN|nr:zinc ribbon domain-containing protein [Sphaerisporangium album]RCG28187.1 zinc ribbon domain-containing protein [Sphaerisporangium album]
MPRLHHLVAGFGIFGSLGLTVLTGFTGLASAHAGTMHPHPSGSTDRVTPGTVRVEARAHVSITLFDDRSTIRRVVREYETPVGTGSGFTVAPDGVVVTATGVVQAEKDPSVYAANKIFAEYFKVKIPADFDEHKLKDPDLNARLRACYPPQGRNSTCSATVTTDVTVFPYADPPAPEGYPAELLHTGTSPGAPAVLKLTKGGEDATLPTVPLGTTLGSGIESVDVAGLPARPSAKAPPKLQTAHLDPPGGRTFKAAERAKLDAFLSDDGDGAAVIDDVKSEVVGLVTGGGGSPETLTPVDDVRAALVAAGVTARRGPVDVVYETGLASFHNKSYANAIPVFEQVLRLRPDHAVAQDHLRVARAGRTAPSGATTPGAAPARSVTGVSSMLPVAIGVVVAGVAVAIAVPLTLRRRRRANAAGDEPPPDAMAGVYVWPSQGTQAMPAAGEGQGTAGQPRTGVPPTGAEHTGTPHAGAGHGAVAEGGQARFCTQCGMRLGQAHRFCGFCGHPVDR